MTIGQKIRLKRQEKKFTQIDLARLSGVSIQSIKLYETDKTNATMSIVEKLAKALNTDVSYFLSPNMSLNVPQYVPQYVPQVSPTQSVVNALQQRTTVKVNYYPNILASAGFGAFNHDVNVRVLELEEGFLMALGLRCFKNLDLITVYGDSMEPFVSNGELIILQRDIEAQNSDIVVANINGEVYVKKLQRDPIKKWIKLTSLNVMYPDIELNEDEQKYLSIIGIVRAKIRPF